MRGMRQILKPVFLWKPVQPCRSFELAREDNGILKKKNINDTTYDLEAFFYRQLTCNIKNTIIMKKFTKL